MSVKKTPATESKVRRQIAILRRMKQEPNSPSIHTAILSMEFALRWSIDPNDAPLPSEWADTLRAVEQAMKS